MVYSLLNSIESKRFWIIFLVVYLFYHLLTLPISPLPWFDETVFLDIANNTARNGTFTFDFAPPVSTYGNEVYAYGPVYFWITGSVIKLFGLGMVQFRIVGLVFILLSALLLKILLGKKWHLFVLIYLLDPLFITASHNARMDSLLLFFGLLSITYILRKTSLFNTIISALLASATILTSPRGMVLIFGVIILLLIRFVLNRDKKTFLDGLLWAVIFSIPILIWIVVIFGNFENLLAYYSSFTQFVGGRFFIPTMEIPLIFLTFILVLFSWIKNFKVFFTELNIISLSGLFFFYYTVSDTGPYSILILPFYIILLKSAIDQLRTNNLINVFPLLLIIGYLGIFSVKSFVVLKQFNQRRPELAHLAFKKIPSGSRVLGDEMYVYAALKKQYSFQYVHLYFDSYYREEYQREVFDYEYIIWSDRLEQRYPQFLEVYKNHSKLVEVDRVEIKKVEIPAIVFKYIHPIDDYSCTVYKRIKE